jgi:AraC family transcriptional regulator
MPPPFAIRSSRSVDDLHVAQLVAAPDAQTPRHEHRAPHLLLVARGELLERTSGDERVLREGTLHYRPVGTAHALAAGVAGGELLRITLHGTASAQRTTFLDDPAASGSLAGDFGRNADRIRHALRSDEPFAALVCKAALLKLFGAAARLRAAPAPEPAWLLRARDHLAARFRESVALRDVARAVDVRPERLARAFRARYGCTVGETIRELRLREAARLLEQSTLPAAEIARRSGFHDASHLNRSFERLHGVTPAQYRRSARR